MRCRIQDAFWEEVRKCDESNVTVKIYQFAIVCVCVFCHCLPHLSSVQVSLQDGMLGFTSVFAVCLGLNRIYVCIYIYMCVLPPATVYSVASCRTSAQA